MRFASLGSGSSGNAALVEENGTCVLIDCGFSVRETERRLARLDQSPESIDAILVTHEHADHIGGVGVWARRYGTQVWMTPGTWARPNLGELPRVELFSCHEPFAVGDLEVWPFPVPHDAREPSQFVIGNGAFRLGILTDAGRSTQHIESQLDGCDALIIECNHDPGMLANGPYPPSLKARVGGGHGHLSNSQTADVLERLNTSGLQHVVAAHLSDKNNRPGLARAAVSDALGCEPEWVTVAEQDNGFGWREIF